MNESTAEIGAVLGALGAALAIVPRARVAILAGLGLVLASVVLLAHARIPGDDLDALVGSAARVAGVVLVALALVAAGLVLARRPALVPLAVLVAAPFRVPVHLGEQEAFLLLPLYAVLAAAGISLVVRILRGEELPPPPRWAAVPAAAVVALAAVSIFWTDDLRAGIVELLFFLVPFAVLFACVMRTPFEQWTPRALAVGSVVLGGAFAAIGISQLFTGDLWFARDLEVANAYTSFQRTTSLFADSSIYARELVVAVVVIVAALWLRRVRLRVAVPALGLLWTGLFFSYSQSSMVALVVGVLALSLVAADRLDRRIILGATAVAVAAAAIVVAFEVRDESAGRATSGRFGLARHTWAVFVHHPGIGVGIGAQPAATREESGRKRAERTASHTTPLTVAAELGILGVLAYLAFLLGAARTFLRAAWHDSALALTLGALFLMLAVHSFFYAGFYENPTVWGTFALAAALVGARRDADASPPRAGIAGR